MKHRKHPLTEQQKVRLGKGMVAALKPVKCAAWMGQQTCVPGNFDKAQAEKNRIAGYWR